MRNLRLYSTEAAFQTYEESKGGDGVTTQTVVPGVSMSLNPRKRYFNPNDKTILVHTVTVNYKDDGGQSIAESGTKRFKYISGVSQEVILTPKNVSGYIPTETSKKVNIPQTNNIDFVYEKDKQKFPLTFRIISAGTVYWKMYFYSNSYKRTIQYRKNGGTWTSITSHTGSSAPGISVVSGDILEFIGDNETYCPANGYHSYFSASTKFSVEGNIMSLIKSTNFEDATTLVSSNTFNNLFSCCYGLTSAIKLALPAKTLSTGCYSYMFDKCSGLTSAPELPATTLSVSACTCMFRGCTSLETAPELPATRLADYCYSYMFSGCTSLTTAPELPATTLTGYCYSLMFYGCSSLSSITCLATDVPSGSCSNWVQGVASSGTFTKHPNMTSWTTGVNGIPDNWVVKNATL